MSLEGCVIVDTKVSPRRRGKIVSVSADHKTVCVMRRKGYVTDIKPEAGRYEVTLKGS